MEHLLRCPPILWHPALDSDQLDLQEKSNTANSEFSADATVPPLSSRLEIHQVPQNCTATNQTSAGPAPIEPNTNRNRRKNPI